jgi:hypothetical protein
MDNNVYIKDGDGLTFLTTTTWSDIQKYQGWSIDKWFPNSKRILIDGRTGWFSIWYKWIDEALKTNSEWFIHIDEDCFVFGDKITETIQYMKENHYSIAGCPDGYHEYRSGNHLALNSFFMIVHRSVLEKWINWKGEYPQFNKDWIEDYPYQKKNDSVYTEYQPWDRWVPNTEPYYNFMWVLKSYGVKFLYLEPGYEDELSLTTLLDGTIKHGWHSRDRWVDRIVSPLHKMTNKERFEKLFNLI